MPPVQEPVLGEAPQDSRSIEEGDMASKLVERSFAVTRVNLALHPHAKSQCRLTIGQAFGYTWEDDGEYILPIGPLALTPEEVKDCATLFRRICRRILGMEEIPRPDAGDRTSSRSGTVVAAEVGGE